MAASSVSTGAETLRPHIEIPNSSASKAADEEGPLSPRSWRHRTVTYQPPSRVQTTGSLDAEDYFIGPRDMAKHSKWPFFMRMHGSVLPKMIIPLLVVTVWSTAITCVSKFTEKPLNVSSLLLTVLGFVVGLAISFRTSSAYERYMEGRKYWSQLQLVSQNLARTIWIHADERDGELGKQDLLSKLTALNLLIAYACAIKHRLRFEPGIDYPDLKERVEYLDTFAKAAEVDIPAAREYSKLKSTGEFLGVTFAESNPRKRIKRSKKPLGNLPLEILNHFSAYVHSIINNETLKIGLYQNQAITGVVALNECLVGLDRVLNTPLPIAYSIAISQITWVYVMVLPFQLYASLEWITIPGTIFAAYIILGLSAIGREIENPFGHDVNDLPLEAFCEELEMDMDCITAQPAPIAAEFMSRPGNMPIWPLSFKSYSDWAGRSKQDVRDALLTKTKADMTVRKSFAVARTESNVDEKNAHQVQHQPQQEA
ncbi:Bestrophin, RFP-TM, chloride channel-domain-containing protein [Boeremia exigua]|uniref:Bestrophin, RFP-TM, chloride channel-domain-containing protein n=1 Tax=Boeremia exigua TaxID=749465 RepID=UPI001E8D5D06|nr:Bestrophin, RFP-TM, chloride channel-domain-containing protein [Boeremia exigua]KAH6611988.1 Bestrophin, RFP-TM, chloride channel-domain-containing protein [Boeremia exigua]